MASKQGIKLDHETKEKRKVHGMATRNAKEGRE
jgi:hypothetical protein